MTWKVVAIAFISRTLRAMFLLGFLTRPFMQHVAIRVFWAFPSVLLSHPIQPPLMNFLMTF
ncbi:hypothetical protein LCM4573_25370 [Rhizobium sp. LCM 4573]|nr:hypothetical protein LCM4573_25370 [Rhizobium sp. LCM 4573]